MIDLIHKWHRTLTILNSELSINYLKKQPDKKKIAEWIEKLDDVKWEMKIELEKM